MPEQWWDADPVAKTPDAAAIQTSNGGSWWEADSIAGAAAPAEPSPEGSFLDRIQEGAATAARFVTGEGHREFDLPELGTSGPDVSAFSSEGMRMLGAYLSTTDPEAIADIAVKTLPDATRKNDKFGNPIISFRGKDFYVNDPGFSEADAFQLTALLAEFWPAAKLGSLAKTLPRRAATTGAGMAATSAGLDIVAGGLGSEQGVDPGKAAVVGGLGAGGEILSPLAARAWRAIKGNPRFVEPATGQLTREGRGAAKASGMSEEELAKLMAENERLAAEYAAEAARPTARDPRVAGVHAEGREFGIDYTAGQAEYAGSVAAGRPPVTKQIRMEEAMHGGRFGESAEATMRGKRLAQREQVARAGEGIQDELAGGTRRLETAAEAGDVVGPGVQRRAVAQEARVSQAYEVAGEKEARFSADSVGDMFRTVRSGLREAGVVIEDKAAGVQLYPATRRAFDVLVKINKEVTKRRKFPQITKQSLKQFELTRRRLGSAIGAAKTGADKRGATIIKKQYDKWMDDAVDNALFEGDADALALLKEARATRTEYGRLYGERGKGDEAGKIIVKILEREPTAEQTINLIYGKAALGGRDVSAKVLARLKDIFGAESAEWAALREAGWLRLFRDRKGDIVSPRVFQSNLARVLNEAPTTMKELFSKSEIAKMRRFGTAALRTLTPDDLVNYSRTADALAHWFRKIIGRMGTRATFSGDPIQAAGLHAIAKSPSFFAGRKAQRLINPRPRPGSALPFVAAAGAAGREE